MIGEVISLIDFLRRNYQEYSTKSALFDYEGKKKEGDDLIEVERINTDKPHIWFYKVKEKDEYVFIYMPVIPALYIDYGTHSGTTNPNSNIFRFVGSPMASFSSGGEANVISDFIVVAYKPKELLRLHEDQK
jgi:hypothetical protein